jgi:hypothetical protein
MCFKDGLKMERQNPPYPLEVGQATLVRVAQEAYMPLKIAEEIIGLLNTAIPRGYEDADQDRRRRNLRKDVAEIENPFDNDKFRDQLLKWVDEFSRMTGSNAIAAQQILDLIDTDLAQRRLPNARAKIADLSLYFMDQTKNYMKREYPW